MSDVPVTTAQKGVVAAMAVVSVLGAAFVFGWYALTYRPSPKARRR